MAGPSVPRTPLPTTRSSSMSTPIVSTSSSLPQLLSQAQHELKQKMRIEYFGQVFASNRLFSKIFRSMVPQNKIDLAIDDCIERFKLLPPLTAKEADEKLHYIPFVARLNAVKESLIRHDCMKDSIYRNVEFEVHDKPMAGGVGNDAALRPDALARIPSGDPDSGVYWEDVELCVEVKNKYGEMIAQGATYARSMSYAQRGRRFVLIIFFEQNKGLVSFGLFSPAWLCLSKTRYDLRDEHGQRGFIKDMACIWSCTDRWSAGFEDICNNVQCFLKGFGTFSYRENICYRNSIRGRRTRVDLIDDGAIWTDKLPLQNQYILRQIQGQNDYYRRPKLSKTASNQLQGSGSSKIKSSRTSAKQPLVGGLSRSEESRGTRSSPRLAAKRLAEQIAVSKGRMRDSPSELPVLNQPPRYSNRTFILKDSWPLVSRKTRESDVFGISWDNEDEDIDGDENGGERLQEFGMSLILHSFFLENSKGELSDTVSMFPYEAESLPRVWDEDGPKQQSNSQTVEHNEPEERIHVLLLISTEGIPLENASSPRELLQAVLHAMIGYSVIFRRRWLHRDVSIGNVLLMKIPEKRKRIRGFEDILTKDILAKHFEKCVGFITDGDLAVRWDKPDRKRAKQRSGTPPFMSCKLLGTLNEEAFHSAIDDLESFVWVLFWAILSIMRLRHAMFTEDEDHYWTHLRSLDINELLAKRAFPDRLFDQQDALDEQKNKRKPGDPPLDNIPSPAFAPFVALLVEWLMLAFSHETLQIRRKLKNAPVDEHERIAQEWIGKYLSIGIKHLDALPDTWDYIP